MARPLRIEYPGAFYHVTSRGNAKGDIFLSRGDRFKFLSYLSTAAERYGLVIHAYCLMGNHYHLMVETPRGNLSQAMHHINSAYTLSFNVRNDRVGHLFQGRYKSILVDSEAYALEISRYIHLNPARAGIAVNPFRYRWSSLGAYAGMRVVPDWLKTDYALSFFRGAERRKKIAYRRFVTDGLEGFRRNPFDDAVASSILGRGIFVDEIKKQFLSDKQSSPEIPAAAKLQEKPSIASIFDAVQKVFDGNSRIQRQATFYFCCRYSGVKLREIGEHFNVGGAAVSMSSRRFSNKIPHDDNLRGAVKDVEGILNC